MPSIPSKQARAQRMDRFMAFAISGGGLTIIAAVLAMLVFIMKESIPLFVPPQSKFLATVQAPPSGGVWVDESGKAVVLLSRTEGLKALRFPEGTALAAPGPAEGPALPWRAFTTLNARGESLITGADGRLFLARLNWSKPAGENDPAQWTLEPRWQGGLAMDQVPNELLHFRLLEAGGLGGGTTLRVVARTEGGLVWSEASLDAPTPLAWKPLPLDTSLHATAALWSSDGKNLFLGTREGRLLILDPEANQVTSQADFGEPVESLGFALGQSSLLVGGAQGKLAAYQRVRVNEVFALQPFHTFPRLSGPVLGFQASQRDKRFLAWTPTEAVVDHLTTERRMMSARLDGRGSAALAPRGDLIVHASEGTGALKVWSLDAPHPEVSFGLLWGKTHYEGYEKPEYVWQSTGGTDDFEPKFSLVPLVFGTLKGTLYAMLFAFPLAVLGALYTSQFATPRLKNTIKPAVEIMAALPSVVLGFLAGLVMAPLLEKMAVEVFIFPFVVLLLAFLATPFWGRLPLPFRNAFGTGREVLWMVPVLLLGVWITSLAGPWVERVAMGGSYRTWLQTAMGVTYDQRNSLVVGFAMGFAVIPIIFTISEDALSSVPKSLTSASLACGASPWQTAWRIVLPTASPGIFSATMVGLGRAIGETMIVLMATGNTPILDWSPFNGMRTLSANIAVEVPEAPLHGTLYRVLFLAAFLLFVLTFILNTVAELVRQRLRRRYESI
ncbi:ABC transporter permease subunit [Geothrix sp. PMB-07]|uniref:ABC transporter permease subunit n=1 Tax=Geothrix sp. PMB-07 TaxID=3068640 RepID=UPI002741E09A|nr:ABC transporter permease subunit [Geothrix sp. PMB-07]WLT33404.1 ABC transporter permease subunit [Geothrix sp. PMB-07]